MSQLAVVPLPPRPVSARKGNMLCLDQYGKIGGGQRSLLDLLPAFTGEGWQVSAAISGAGPFGDMLDAQGIQHFALSSRKYTSTKKSPLDFVKYALELPVLTRSLRKIVEAQRIELLYVNGPRLLPPAAWLACKTQIPLVFHCHNRLFQESAAILAGEALRMANARVIASCRYAAEPIREFIWPERLSVLYNGVQRIALDQPRLVNKSWRIAVVGRVEREKGQLEFVQAAKLVGTQFPGCRFRVIGSPMFSGSDYYDRVIAAAYGGSIDFQSWQSDLSKLYSGIDLLVVPSNGLEATTRVIMEAFGAGIPVVAFPCGGIPEIVDDERTGFLTREPTSEALANRILMVLRMDRKLLRLVVTQARKEWAERFSLDSYRRSVNEVLAEAWNERSRK